MSHKLKISALSGIHIYPTLAEVNSKAAFELTKQKYEKPQTSELVRKVVSFLTGARLSFVKLEAAVESEVSFMHWVLSGPLGVEKLTVEGGSPTSASTSCWWLSDFHYDGLRLSEEMLEQAIAASNQAEPDLVLLTGDYVTDNPADSQAGTTTQTSAKSLAFMLYWATTIFIPLVKRRYKLL